MSKVQPQRSDGDSEHQSRGKLHKGFDACARRVEQLKGIPCTPRYIKQEKEAGRLAYVKFANRLFFRDEDIEVWFDSLRRNASQSRPAPLPDPMTNRANESARPDRQVSA